MSHQGAEHGVAEVQADVGRIAGAPFSPGKPRGEEGPPVVAGSLGLQVVGITRTDTAAEALQAQRAVHPEVAQVEGLGGEARLNDLAPQGVPPLRFSVEIDLLAWSSC